MKNLNPYRHLIDYPIYKKWNNYFEGVEFNINNRQALPFIASDNNNITLLCNIITEQDKQIESLKSELENSKSDNVWLERAMTYKSKLEELNRIMAEDLDSKTSTSNNKNDFYIKYIK